MTDKVPEGVGPSATSGQGPIEKGAQVQKGTGFGHDVQPAEDDDLGQFFESRISQTKVPEPEPRAEEMTKGADLRGRATPIEEEVVEEEEETAPSKKPDMKKAAKLLGASIEEVTLATSEKARQIFGLESKPKKAPEKPQVQQPKPQQVKAKQVAQQPKVPKETGPLSQTIQWACKTIFSKFLQTLKSMIQENKPLDAKQKSLEFRLELENALEKKLSSFDVLEGFAAESKSRAKKEYGLDDEQSSIKAGVLVKNDIRKAFLEQAIKYYDTEIGTKEQDISAQLKTMQKGLDDEQKFMQGIFGEMREEVNVKFAAMNDNKAPAVKNLLLQKEFCNGDQAKALYYVQVYNADFTDRMQREDLANLKKMLGEK